MQPKRCPVRYKNKVLMPTNWKKAARLVKEGKAIWVKDKVLGTYLKLKFDPGSYETQPMAIAIDQGTMFEGISIVSKKDNRNLQFNYTQLTNNKNSIKQNSETRRMYRRLRRSRLRHRPARYSSRTGRKLTHTIHYYYQYRRNNIERICKLYPITDIVIEDCKFRHDIYNNGSSFSNLEVGKNLLREFIKSKGLYLTEYQGYETKEIRDLLDIGEKNEDKGIRNFYSHCIDSISLGVRWLLELYGGDEEIINFFRDKVDKLVTFIDRIIYNRRNLHQYKIRQSDSMYFRWDKGMSQDDPSIGNWHQIHHFSKLRKIRVKVDDRKSNHGPWNYIYLERYETYKMTKVRYGGTIINSYWCKLRKSWNWLKSKYLTEIGNYKYYDIELI